MGAKVRKLKDCVFCDIVAGKEPRAKLFEDEHCIVILDIRPIYHGHALVIPKRHCTDLLDAPADSLGPMLTAAQRVAPAVLKATGSEAFNILQSNGAIAGQTVFHLHFHILPRRRGDSFAGTPLKDLERIEMAAKRLELDEMAGAIRDNL